MNNLIIDLNLENKNQFNKLLGEINLDENFIKKKLKLNYYGITTYINFIMKKLTLMKSY